MADVNLTIKTNATFDQVFIWTNVNGTRRSLAGYAAALQVRKKAGGPVLLDLSSAAGTVRLQLDPYEAVTTGVYRLLVPALLTAAIISPGPFPYDLRLWAVNADKEPSYRLMEGFVTFDVGVTSE